MVLLWSNPSPTSNFSAQTIPLDLSEYSFVGITMRKAKPSGDDAALHFNIVGVGWTNARVFGHASSLGYIYDSYRNVTVTTSGVTFSSGYETGLTSQGYIVGNSSANTAQAIPCEIYGIKA